MSGRVYQGKDFKTAMDSNYYPLENMKNSVDDADKLAEHRYRDDGVRSVSADPVTGSGKPERSQGVAEARRFCPRQLDGSGQQHAVSKDEPDVVPLTKCALMDASVRKCFNSTPPICMQVNVTQRAKDDPDADKHDILLVWEYPVWKQRADAFEFDDGLSLYRS